MPRATAATAAPVERVYLTWDQIQEVEQSDGSEDVYLPAWGGYVKIRPVSVREVTRTEELSTDSNGNRDETRVKVHSIINSLIHPSLSFTQVSELVTNGKRAAALAQLWDAINKCNALGGEAIAVASKSAGAEPEAGSAVRDSAEVGQDT